MLKTLACTSLLTGIFSVTAIIIVGTPTWSQDIENAVSSPITGYNNIAYAFHFYAGTHKASMRSRLEVALKKKIPVIVTEFGISDASGNGSVNTSEGTKWMTLLDKYQTGRVCWNLSNKNESSAIIKSSCKKLSGWNTNDLSSTGAFLLKTYTGKPATSTTTKPAASSSSSSSSGTLTGSISVSSVTSWKQGSYTYTQYKILIKNTRTKNISNWTASVSVNYIGN